MLGSMRWGCPIPWIVSGSQFWGTYQKKQPHPRPNSVNHQLSREVEVHRDIWCQESTKSLLLLNHKAVWWGSNSTCHLWTDTDPNWALCPTMTWKNIRLIFKHFLNHSVKTVHWEISCYSDRLPFNMTWGCSHATFGIFSVLTTRCHWGFYFSALFGILCFLICIII